MKLIILSCFVLLLVINGCKDDGEAAIKRFIPGSYIKFSDGEYSKAWDTLIIQRFHEEEKTYIIARHIGFQKIRRGRLQPKQYSSDTSIVVFHPTTFQLQHPVTGKLYTFSPDSHTVLAGSALYQKIE